MSYSLATIWYERNRFLPGILAVTFSAVLIAIQCGLLLGMFSTLTIPIDRTKPGTIVVDESERDRLGVSKVGDVAEVVGCRVRVVGFVRGSKGLAGVFVFCSIPTARTLLAGSGLRQDQVMYLLARCRNPQD